MKKDYMTRLERAARWRLPPQEAEDVIADYRDIVSNPPRTEEELRREVGDPEQVIKLLVSPPRAYRTWQVVFGILAFCILSLGISGTLLGFPFWELYFLRGLSDWRFGYGESPYNALIVAALGLVTALVWFRWKGYKSERFPKAILILVGVLTVWTGGILLADLLILRDPVGFSEALGEVPSFIGPNLTVSLSVRIWNYVLAYSALAMALLGTFALVRARTQDRRWAAVYVLAMGALLVPLQILDMYGSMDPTYNPFVENWYLPYLGQHAATFVVGLLGAGVALC